MSQPALPSIVQQVIDEIWTKGDLEVADRLFTPEYTNHGGLIPDLVQGPEAIKVSVTMYRLAFPGLQIVVDDLSVDGNTATLRWEARTGASSSGAPRHDADETVSMAGAMVVRFEDGRIAESWTSWNQAEALRQFRLYGASEPDFAA